MLAFDARFVLLAVICGLSTQWLSSPLANAAVIVRSPQSSSSSSSQHPLPMSKAKHRSSKHSSHPHTTLRPQNRRMHKVRALETNLFNLFLNAALSRSQHSSHRKRSGKAIVIPDDHGSQYLVSHSRRGGATTPQWIANPGSSASSSSSSNTTTTTAQSTDGNAQGVPGVIQIQSHMYNATEDRTIASLFMTESNGTYVLNASDKNETQLYLVNAPPTSTRQAVTSGPGGDIPVYLTIPNLQDSRTYCATYDPNPSQAEPMTMTPCMGYTAASSDSSSMHTSQTFLYNSTSGQVRPTWFMEQDDGTTNVSSPQDDANNSSSSSSSSISSATNTSTSALPSSSSTSFGTRDDGSAQQPPTAQNVTLIFVPTGFRGTTAASDISESENSTNGSSSSTPMTTTMTQTVTVYASKSSSSSSLGPSTSATGLNVEVVGGNPMISTSSSSISAQPSSVSASASASGIAAMDIGSSTITAPASSSIDAAAIASNIAASVSSSMAASRSSTSVSVSASAFISSSMSSASVSSSATQSVSDSAGVADVSSSLAPSSTASSSTQANSTSTTSPSSNTFIAAVMQRAKMLGRAAEPEMTPVKTDPYKWKFHKDQ